MNCKRLTIDRKNNNLPYSIENIVFACTWCNKVKGEILTEEEMLQTGKIILNKWKKLL